MTETLAETLRIAVSTIPPAFLILCGLNVVFLHFVLRFVEHQAAARTAVIGRVLDACLSK